jgi:hypothetical protein
MDRTKRLTASEALQMPFFQRAPETTPSQSGKNLPADLPGGALANVPEVAASKVAKGARGGAHPRATIPPKASAPCPPQVLDH